MPQIIDNTIALISKLPGLGPRSARRLFIYLLQNPEKMMRLSELFASSSQDIKRCVECNNFDDVSPCGICSDMERDAEVLCVVESISELWAIERSKLYNGHYHVLGGNLSIIDNRTPETLNMFAIKNKVVEKEIKEVILATNSTLEGQTTAHYIAEMLTGLNIKITKLAHGIPIGAELEYMDDGTLNVAFQLRQNF
ncbi:MULTISPECIES: recombination mediator RecR [unclassified Candidatus Lariskella]|uniref:recombination mediator RecR n=1 Tax=unclassified Candidatus Lariskella TaxID=2632605 RepID=UPI0030D62332